METYILIEEASLQLEQSPDDPSLLFWRARLFIEHREFALALQDLDRSLAADPRNPEPLIYRGMACHGIGDATRALLDLNSYIRDGTPSFLAHETRAEIRYSLDDLDGAVRDLTRAIELNPRPDPFSRRAFFYREMGRPRDAAASYREGIERLGHPVSLILGLIDLDVDAGFYDDALEWIGYLEARGGRAEPWLLRRAEVHALAGRTTESRELYRTVLANLEERERSGRLTQFMLLERVTALVGLDRTDEAREAFSGLGPAARFLAQYHTLAERLGLSEPDTPQPETDP